MNDTTKLSGLALVIAWLSDNPLAAQELERLGVNDQKGAVVYLVGRIGEAQTLERTQADAYAVLLAKYNAANEASLRTINALRGQIDWEERQREHADRIAQIGRS